MKPLIGILRNEDAVHNDVLNFKTQLSSKDAGRAERWCYEIVLQRSNPR